MTVGSSAMFQRGAALTVRLVALCLRRQHTCHAVEVICGFFLILLSLGRTGARIGESFDLRDEQGSKYWNLSADNELLRCN